MTWIPPGACTLPTLEQPLRVLEFDALFNEALLCVVNDSPQRATLVLDGSRGVLERARELAARESSCCSFFSFDFALHSSGDVLMSLEVPLEQVDVLQALLRRALSGSPHGGPG